MRAEVIAIGDELTSGQRLDTNSQWLSHELGLLGVPVAFHTTACDTLEAGIEAFAAAADRAEIVVATGGLGPTADDLTRDVLAGLAGVPLDLSAEALAAVESRFARRGAAMPESNRRQALFPRGSRVIPNPDGTAPGIDLALDRGGRASRIFALPGVPSEMKRMWRETVADAVVAMRPERGVFLHRRVKCFGAGESAIEAMLPDLIRRGRDPLVGITAHEATITLRITARGGSVEECRGKIGPTEATIRECLGPLVYGFEDDELEDALVRRLVHAGQTVATVEIATEGLVASLLAQAVGRLEAGHPADGRGTVFRGGAVLPAAAADAEGVVRLAEEARGRFGGSLGLAVGRPQPHAEGRQAVAIAAVGPFGHRETLHVLGGAAGLARSRAAKTAVDLLRSVLPEALGEGR